MRYLRSCERLCGVALVLLLLMTGVAGCGRDLAPADAPATQAVNSGLAVPDVGTFVAGSGGSGGAFTSTATRVTRATRTPQAHVAATATTGPRPTKTAAPSATRKPGTTATPRDGLATIREQELPREGRTTLALIRRGGPFPFARDGVVFQNREGLLPARPRGYYHEYTVITPGENDRGARRIITGDGGELYYTDDHYGSFKRVVP